MNTWRIVNSALVLFYGIATLLSSETNLTVVVLTGDPAPDGNGRFSTFLEPSLNDAGQVAFCASLTGTTGGASDNRGVFRADAAGVRQIARAGQAAPDGNGVLTFGINYPAINAQGDVAFWAALAGTAGGPADDEGIFRGDGSKLVQLARAGQPVAPGSSNKFVRLLSDTAEDPPVTLNDRGEVVFWASLNGEFFDPDQGLFLADGSKLTEIARRGSPAGNSPGTYARFEGATEAINNLGFVAFEADLAGGFPASQYNVFLSDGVSPAQRIAFSEMPAPDGNGRFSTFGFVTLNNAGWVAFQASMSATASAAFSSGDFSNVSGFATKLKSPTNDVSGFVRDQLRDATRQALASWPGGDPFPPPLLQAIIGDLNRLIAGPSIWDTIRFANIPLRSETMALNQNNTVGADLIRLNRFLLEDAFPAELKPMPEFGKPGPSFLGVDTGGVFLFDGTNVLQIVRTAQAAPDDNGQFGGIIFSPIPALNNSGQVAFLADLHDTLGGSSDNQGIFRGNGVVLTQIIRDGQTAPDGNGRFSIDDFSFSYFHPAMNDSGQMVFVAKLTGTTGGNGDNDGIFFFDDTLGLVKVARKGDPFMGSRFDSFDLTLATLPTSPELTGLNNPGQVAFKFKLTDGRQGIAIWNAPAVARTVRLLGRYEATLKEFVISWPENLVGWILESTDNPADPLSWSGVSESPAKVGNEFQVSVPAKSGSRFFRLRQSQQ